VEASERERPKNKTIRRESGADTKGKRIKRVSSTLPVFLSFVVIDVSSPEPRSIRIFSLRARRFVCDGD
jgi:hypothetical protein